MNPTEYGTCFSIMLFSDPQKPSDVTVFDEGKRNELIRSLNAQLDDMCGAWGASYIPPESITLGSDNCPEIIKHCKRYKYIKFPHFKIDNLDIYNDDFTHGYFKNFEDFKSAVRTYIKDLRLSINPCYSFAELGAAQNQRDSSIAYSTKTIITTWCERDSLTEREFNDFYNASKLIIRHVAVDIYSRYTECVTNIPDSQISEGGINKLLVMSVSYLKEDVENYKIVGRNHLGGAHHPKKEEEALWRHLTKAGELFLKKTASMDNYENYLNASAVYTKPDSKQGSVEEYETLGFCGKYKGHASADTEAFLKQLGGSPSSNHEVDVVVCSGRFPEVLQVPVVEYISFNEPVS